MQSGNNNPSSSQNDGTATPTHNGQQLPVMPFQPATAQANDSQRNSPHPSGPSPQVFLVQANNQRQYLPAIAAAAAAAVANGTAPDGNIDPAIANVGAYRYDPQTHYIPPGHLVFPPPPPPQGLDQPPLDQQQQPEMEQGEDGEWKPKLDSNGRARKPRREKPKIELAADQPPTTQGKPRARVYVACAQCRGRKIRCDGAKPVCHNCSRRANGAQECLYDTQPKRRGPDKVPGARQRVSRDQHNPEDAAEFNPGPPKRRRKRAADQQQQQLNNADPNAQFQQAPPPNVASMYPPDPTAFLQQQQQRPGDLPGPPGFVGDRSPMGFHGPGPDQLTGAELMYPPPPRRLDDFNYSDEFDTGSCLSEDDDSLYDEHQQSPYQQQQTVGIIRPPTLDFSRKTWWDSVLILYLCSPASSSSFSPIIPFTSSFTSFDRESAARSIISDIRFAFRVSNYWLSFVHVPSFFSFLLSASERPNIQPSLILSLLSLSMLWQSSEVGLKEPGRQRALYFRAEAQMALEASINTGSIDVGLAMAAYLLALFEVSCHPDHSTARTTSSMRMLDAVIRGLSLAAIDVAEAPSTFPPWTSTSSQNQQRPNTYRNPSSPEVAARGYSFTAPSSSSSSGPSRVPGSPATVISSSAMSTSDLGCSCSAFTLGAKWPSSQEHVPCWITTPAWDPSCISKGNIEKESCRRLCWSVILLAAGNASYSTASDASASAPDFYVGNPTNFTLLFSGESLLRTSSLSAVDPSYPKRTVWSLYDRIMLLWLGCIRMRQNKGASDAEKAAFAVKAWVEADHLEEELNKHTCAIERSFIFQGREYIFNVRMSISFEFRRFIPLVNNNSNALFNRQKAEEWLHHQRTVAERFMFGLSKITGYVSNTLARRPFFVFWFMGQIQRSLRLWETDNTLTSALDVCKSLIPATDYLTALWPSAEQRRRYKTLRAKLHRSCLIAGVTPPSREINLDLDTHLNKGKGKATEDGLV